jgi:tetratricopeptide (TPR) repeat protein
VTGNQEVFQRLMNQGHTAAWDQNWENASQYYQKALDEFPDHPQALSNLGLSYYEQKRYDEALVCYQRAFELNPNDAVSLEKMARICEKTGQTAKAIQYYMDAAELFLKARNVDKTIDNWKKVADLEPTNLMAHSRLATIYDRLGRKANAVEEYVASAAIMQSQGDMVKAYQVIQYVQKLTPEYEEAGLMLQMLDRNEPLPLPTGDSYAARPEAEAPTGPKQLPKTSSTAPLKIDPVMEARQRSMARLAAQLFDLGEDSSPDGLINRKGIGGATRGSGGLSQENADRARITLYLGQAIQLQSAGDEAGAVKPLEQALEIGLQTPDVFYDLGYMLSTQDGQKSFRYLQESVKHPDYSLGSYLLIAQLYEASDQYAEAALSYLQALRQADMEMVSPEEGEELSQGYEPILEDQVNLTDLAAQQKLSEVIRGQLLRADWRQYLTMARQQLPLQPEGSPPITLASMLLETSGSQIVDSMSLIRQYTVRGYYRTAMEEAYSAMSYAPTYLPLHIQMGEILVKEGRTSDAVHKFMTTADLYSLRGDSAQAIRLLTRITQMASMDLSVRSRLIELLAAQHRVDEALQQYVDLAGIYYQLAEFEMAKRTYMAAVKLAQQNGADRKWVVEILYKVADIDMQRLDWRGAIKIYEQVKAMQPEADTPRARLVDLYFRLGQPTEALAEVDAFTSLLESSDQRPKAIGFIKDLIQEHVEIPDLYLKLADLMIRLGQTNKAVEVLGTGADALTLAGKKPEAIELLKKAISLNPTNVADYQKTLRQLQMQP